MIRDFSQNRDWRDRLEICTCGRKKSCGESMGGKEGLPEQKWGVRNKVEGDTAGEFYGGLFWGEGSRRAKG